MSSDKAEQNVLPMSEILVTPVDKYERTEGLLEQTIKRFIKILDRTYMEAYASDGFYRIIRAGSSIVKVGRNRETSKKIILENPLLIITKEPDKEQGSITGMPISHSETRGNEIIFPHNKRVRVDFTSYNKEEIFDTELENMFPYKTNKMYLDQRNGRT